MTRKRFEFALIHVNPTLWESFEDLASAFLADEYQSLRTLAGSGDRGRDAILWQPEDDPTVILQYSLRKDWDTKILESARKISREFPDTQLLIYVTNQRVGAKADLARVNVRKKYHLHLDIRDRTWFLERHNRSPSTITASDEFSNLVVDPILASDAIIDSRVDVLTAREARAAVLFLSMQWEDSTREKGLTKLSFEALVWAALRHTDNEHRMSREDVIDSVLEMIQSDNVTDVKKYTNAALERLKKRKIRHWKQQDEFCLSFEERRQRLDALIEMELLDEELYGEILEALTRSCEALEESYDEGDLEQLVPLVRRVLESFLLQRGEAFAQSLAEGQLILLAPEEVESICVDKVAEVDGTNLAASDAVPIIVSSIEQVLIRPTTNVQKYLRALADAYTLLAFLRQVPDVQKAVRKLFDYGKIWLDTSAVLPLLAEMLLEEDERSYTRTLQSARHAGMELFVTPGVVEELYHHILHSRRCQQMGPTWRSRTPFLYAAYLWSGRPPVDFKTWTIEFIGKHRPLADIVDFLFDVAEISECSLQNEVESARENVRWAVDEYWRRVHVGRSQVSDASRDPEVANMLADHDIENFLGIIVARESENRTNSLGYQHWWLTLDRRAYRATNEICDGDIVARFDSPVMSYDFLIDYLAFGPRRSDVPKSEERLLPLMLDMSLLDGIPSDILEIAEATRIEMSEYSDRLVQREIRDRLDAAKLRRGPVAKAGMEAIETDLHDAFRESA